MKLHGYTDERETVAVDLSIDEIVAAEIDPWRLDLFDPHPIVHEVGRRKLNFRRLKDVAFHFVEQDSGNHMLAVDDDKGRICLVSNSDKLHAADGSVSARSGDFNICLAEYLRALEQSGTQDRDDDAVALPTAASALRIRPDGSFFVDPNSMPLTDQALSYVGDMFLELAASVRLPHLFNRIHSGLAAWHPIIYGHALGYALAGKPCSSVHVVLDGEGLRHIEQALPGKKVHDSESAVFLDYDDVRLMVFRNRSGMFPHYFQDNDGRHSIGCLYSTQANLVCGSRIAFHDAAQLFARILFRSVEREHSKGIFSVTEELVADGFRKTF